MEELYLKILEAFDNNAQLFIDAEFNPPRQIDLHRGQPDDEAAELFLPAIFLDIAINGDKSDSGPDATTLVVHILMDNGPGTESYSYNREDGLKYLRYIAIVKKILNKLKTDTTSNLIYFGENAVQSTFFRYMTVSYNCNTVRNNDSVNDRTYIKITKPPVEITVDNNL